MRFFVPAFIKREITIIVTAKKGECMHKRQRTNGSANTNTAKKYISPQRVKLEYETNIVQIKSILLGNIIQKLNTLVSERGTHTKRTEHSRH